MKTLALSVSNMESAGGNTSPNQFRMVTNSAVLFKSYESFIAMLIGRDHPISKELMKTYPRFGRSNTNDLLVLSERWDYNNTTARYRNAFLNETKKDIEKRIDKQDILTLSSHDLGELFERFLFSALTEGAK